MPEAEAASGIVELRRAGAEIKAERVGGDDPVVRGNAVDIGEVALGEDESVTGDTGEALAGSGDRGGVTVDGEDPPGRTDPVQEHGGHAATTQGTVNGNLACTGLQVLY
jgi:hypothetical protein